MNFRFKTYNKFLYIKLNIKFNKQQQKYYNYLN